jgi:transcription initiation factor IIF auxiliary subunit
MTLKIAQGYEYAGDNYWKWWVWLEGSTAELDAVDYVVYKLHPTFPSPVRKVSTRDTKFRLETAGWGVFRLYAKVVFTNKSVVNLEHDLELRYPDDAGWVVLDK